MYLQKLELKNTGPIEHITIECIFGDDGYPKPIVLVGKNGSGKSIAIAHVVNALTMLQGKVFEDSDVDRGKVYKLRSPVYVRQGSTYSTGEVEFSNGICVSEIQLTMPKDQYQEPVPAYKYWDKVPANENSLISTNSNNMSSDVKDLLNHGTHIFFPPNRYEEPAWLNELSLRNKANYPSLRNFTNYSNRPIVNYAPLRELQNWLLDLIYDSHALETHSILVPGLKETDGVVKPQVFTGRDGPATQILKPIEKFLRTIFRKSGELTWHVGSRNTRRIGILIDEEIITNNLFALSSGETVLLDLFLTIIRDFDLSDAPLSSLNDIQGMVIIDEIDLHLHTDLQHDLLPNLIQLFPRVQFILTTHSPLLLIGMEKTLTNNGFQIFEFPEGREIEVERFSEFKSAFECMKETAHFEEEIRTKVKESEKPVLFLEGSTDIRYLNKAAELLEKTDLLKCFELTEFGGSTNLDKIWNARISLNLSTVIKQKWLLLYDCDVNKSNVNEGKLFRRKIPQQNHNIKSGIENLFSNETIQKARDHKFEFVDITTHTKKRVGEKIRTSQKNGKLTTMRNLCDWICETGKRTILQSFRWCLISLKRCFKAKQILICSSMVLIGRHTCSIHRVDSPVRFREFI